MSTEFSALSPWIKEDLAKSGLSPETIGQMGIEEISALNDGTDKLKSVLGFAKMGEQSILQTTEAYIIHYPENGFARVKLHRPIEGAKYLSPKRAATETAFHLYYLPSEKSKLNKPSYSLIITEGEKKAAKLTQELHCHLNGKAKTAVVGLPGVTMWNGCPEWKGIRLSGRDVFLCFDADFRNNADVEQQLLSLLLWLRKKKANVKVMLFDQGKGIDDYLVYQQKEGFAMAEVVSELLTKAEKNVFDLLSHINGYRLADAAVAAFYSIKEDCKVLWDEFKLGKKLGITFSTFQSLISKAYKQRNAAAKAKEKEALATADNSGQAGEEKDKGLAAKPVIKIIGGQLTETVDQAEAAIQAENPLIYQRSGCLVRVLADAKPPKGIKRSSGAVTVQTVEIPYLVELFTQKATFVKYHRREDEWTPTDCPKPIAETYLARGTWKVPVLTGIIQAPTLRPDGSLLQKPGYDEDTGLLYLPGDTKFSPIPEHPTKEDAKNALKTWQTLLADFPFVEPSDFSTALSGFLSALIRYSLSTAPLFGLSAPKSAVGKTLLANSIAMVATGRNAAVMNQAESAEEEKKRLLSVLMECDPVVCVDNIERPFASDALCSVLTQEIWKDRLLGKNKTVTVPTTATFLATGNNLTFQGDMTSRALLCQLDANCERPEERTFPINLPKYIMQHRDELVRAGLIILRAYHVAGRPKQKITPFGRFEEWSDWVRSALVWLGLSDPCITRKRIEDADPVRANLRVILNCWHECSRDALTLKQVVQLAQGNEAFYDALMEMAGEKGQINQRKLGQKLKTFVGRIEDGLRLDVIGRGKSGFCAWRVRSIA